MTLAIMLAITAYPGTIHLVVKRPTPTFRGGRAFYGGRGYYGGPGYYGPGFGFGVVVYAPYGYAAPVCNPAGFYDQYGNWQYHPGCAVPYGY
jgi:hypothetical protein